MQDHIESIRMSIQTRNWISALFISLTLPDICGALEKLQQGKTRYSSWFDKYFDKRYARWISGDDWYYLRCKFLHEGIGYHPSANNSGIIFTPPIGEGLIHLNKIEGKIQLRVDLFCEDICKATEKWLDAHKNNSGIQTAINELLNITYPDSSGILTLK
jgi:hypothetical protein